MSDKDEKSEFEKDRDRALEIQSKHKLITLPNGSCFLETNEMRNKRLKREAREIKLEKQKEQKRKQVRDNVTRIVEESGSTENAIIEIFSRILVEQREFRNSTIRAFNLIGQQNNRLDDLLVKLTEEIQKLIELLKLVQK